MGIGRRSGSFDATPLTSREGGACTVGCGGGQVVRRESTDGVVWKRVNIPNWKKGRGRKGVRSRREGRNDETDRERIESGSRGLPAERSEASGAQGNYRHDR